MQERNRRALDAPTQSLVLIDEPLIARAIEHSRGSERRRVIQPFHTVDADPLHRMLNVVQPDSYIRPHRHLDPPKAEGWVVLRGALLFFTFEDDGRVRDCVRVGGPNQPIGVDLKPGVFHSFVALEPDTVIYEVKPGPYVAQNDKAFAPWAPPEGDPAAEGYRLSLLQHLPDAK